MTRSSRPTRSHQTEELFTYRKVVRPYLPVEGKPNRPELFTESTFGENRRFRIPSDWTLIEWKYYGPGREQLVQ